MLLLILEIVFFALIAIYFLAGLAPLFIVVLGIVAALIALVKFIAACKQ